MNLLSNDGLKELLKNGYLWLFKVVFNFCKVFPKKNKVTFVVGFTGNPTFVINEMIMNNLSAEIVLLCKPKIIKPLQRKFNNISIIPFESPNAIQWIRAIRHLASSKIIIIDNYYAFLSVIDFKEGVECIQLWHAAGALKAFGLKDRSVIYRNEIAKQRFRKVYQKFDKVIVGSDAMANIFMDAFDVSRQSILRTGIPRTDFFYNLESIEAAQAYFYSKYPIFKEKKVILYAPTFRDYEFDSCKMHLDIREMYQELNDEYVLLIKLHPTVKIDTNLESQYPNFAFDFSSLRGINRLLTIVDFLITDYSSIPFEFAFLKKPMIFFLPDLKTYQRERGTIPNFLQEIPGPKCFDTSEIIEVIKGNQFDIKLIHEFSNKWNRYSNGTSSKKLEQYIRSKLT
ncbi:CDP-glycerol glycerophosphotransferase family protein [Bacillus marasmi]|uniref:CDP-glycerol glycerophosphotransferase family protein n=1 Tax=Bacillus marasmi TaxID=1926279 RepID=UPI0011C6FB52|nr:CDP-glycerol glycerophosphotransferase family protein [Bacillus marasmi]